MGLFVVAGIAGRPDPGVRQAIAAPPSTAVSSAPTTTAVSSAPTTTAVVEVPADLVGKNAEEARTALTGLGFTVDYQSVDGRNVIVASNWTVIAVERAVGTTRIVLRVDKAPAATKPSPTTASPEPPPVAGPPRAEPEVTKPAANVYYKNCDAARAAGAAPLHVGEPGYRPDLDRNHDGLACE
ncbi:excalibur calcium-binding domain-containing protein [Actinokineospora sp. NBRC 105648]|uniref:excalibur calcium-binding domain-containing protein n=1 Tax=Actinokineospora sp. NBRC 105648 TaxID=3032206 RepID=UPI002553809E|nr:excalibur calcium-binding domain-containing protein [Actinokineospora sp. NBRC 105648]